MGYAPYAEGNCHSDSTPFQIEPPPPPVFDWAEPFDYPAGPLIGQGPWLNGGLSGASPIVAAPGTVINLDAMDPAGALADDEFFDTFDINSAWTYTAYITLPEAEENGILSLFLGAANGTYLGVDISTGDDYNPGEVGFTADGKFVHTPATIPFDAGAKIRVTFRYDGANLSLEVNGDTLFAPAPADLSDIDEPYPEFDYQGFDSPTYLLALNRLELTLD